LRCTSVQPQVPKANRKYLNDNNFGSRSERLAGPPTAGANGQAGQPGKAPPRPESKVIRKIRNMAKILNEEWNWEAVGDLDDGLNADPA
jgi:hypothetical protein